MCHLFLAILVALLVVIPSPRPATSGPLVDCCQKLGAGGFCVIPWVGGGGACGAFGGVLFRANACTAVPDCGVAHQLVAAASATIQTPRGSDTVTLSGIGDLIETEMIQLQLQGTSPVLGPVNILKDPTRPALGGLNPPNSFPADSFFDITYRIDLNGNPVSNPIPQRLLAPTIFSFPPLGVPYKSTGPVAFVDQFGQLAGSLLSMEIVFSATPDSDGDKVVDSADFCPDTLAGAVTNDNGCSIDQLCPCSVARNHGEYVSCVAKQATAFRAAGLLHGEDAGRIVSQAARSECGKRPPTTSSGTSTPPR